MTNPQTATKHPQPRFHSHHALLGAASAVCKTAWIVSFATRWQPLNHSPGPTLTQLESSSHRSSHTSPCAVSKEAQGDAKVPAATAGHYREEELLAPRSPASVLYRRSQQRCLPREWETRHIVYATDIQASAANLGAPG